MVKFTHWLVHRVIHLLHAKFQQISINGFDAMTILVMTYFMDGLKVLIFGLQNRGSVGKIVGKLSETQL